MPYLRNAIYALLLLIVSPYLALRAWRDGKYRQGWAQKLWGRVPRRLGNQPCVWLHAVSVGEVKLLRPLIEQIERKRPDWEIRISTTTSTGMQLALNEYPEHVIFYAPLDFSWAVRRAVARVRPTALVLAELELWPNLIQAAAEHGARVAIINGRLSEHSFKGYLKIRWALASTMRRIDLVAAQSDTYASRFRALGIGPGRLRVTGSIKYDGVESDRSNTRTLALRRALGISASDVVFVAGSTMEGEEQAALDAYRAARAVHHRLRLIVVPRHKERFDAVARLLEAAGDPISRRSLLEDIRGERAVSNSICLIDTIGELSAVWGLADIAFVGGSLFPGRGGQNMMEPAAYGAALLFGMHTHNFDDAVEGLLSCGGARRVADPGELATALLTDLDDPEAANERAIAGREFVLAQHGAASRTFSELERLVGATVPMSLVGSRG